MPRRSTKSRSARAKRALPARFRRTKAFFWLNALILLGGGVWYFLQPPGRQAEVRQLVGNTFAENKRVDPLDVAWDLYQLYYSPDFVSAAPAPGDRTHLYAGAPVAANSPAQVTRLLTNTGYLVGYDDNVGVARWAAYRVADISPLPTPAERPDRFDVDRRTVARIDSDAYTGTGYDRGHLAPNYAIATRYGEPAQRETFLMSNIIPQLHRLNAGLWKQLEMEIATAYPARFSEIWVLCGPVLGNPPARLPGSARNRPAIPEACYMILVDESDGRVRAQAFLFPSSPADSARLGDFLVTIDELEQRTGLDFLPALPDPAESALESKRATRVW
ncbi:DNA/RNA non-specific endonuclease [Actomonas aquatica]|uniref:DNA/RNA non-specific endonuclease n=1 Tax=Actomonas aquatica TaxID=2866162 RepID=A0ABZ1C3X2_9BACT|nr:DNA/RNA non-specific endonuclease [Opitutus sp. WL0086]WRQ86305.1 DNA/RNA non-specific endonuclease [Opitutus sp. WL0086]